MYIYHGSNHKVSQPDPFFKSRATVDFGRGFYTTTSREQASRWTLTAAKRSQTGQRTLNIYELNDLFKRELEVKEFIGPTEEWLDFVLASRMGVEQVLFYTTYDIITGPVADDSVARQLALLRDGLISREVAIKQLRSDKLFNQIVFKSPRSFEYLHFIKEEVIANEPDTI